MENGLENSRVEAGKPAGTLLYWVHAVLLQRGREKGTVLSIQGGTADMSPTLGYNVPAKVRVPMRVRFIKKKDFQSLKKTIKNK